MNCMHGQRLSTMYVIILSTLCKEPMKKKHHPQRITHQELSDTVGTADTRLYADCH